MHLLLGLVTPNLLVKLELIFYNRVWTNLGITQVKLELKIPTHSSGSLSSSAIFFCSSYSIQLDNTPKQTKPKVDRSCSGKMKWTKIAFGWMNLKHGISNQSSLQTSSPISNSWASSIGNIKNEHRFNVPFYSILSQKFITQTNSRKRPACYIRVC